MTDPSQYPGAPPEALDRLTDPGLLAPYIRAVTVGGGKVAAYMDHTAYRSIADRLLGAANHSQELTGHPTRQEPYTARRNGKDIPGTPGGTGAVARITVRIAGSPYPKIAEGAGSNDSEAPDTGYKGAASDAVKRAWTNLGLGVALNRLPQMRCDVKNDAQVAQVIARWRQLLTEWQALVDQARADTSGTVAVDPAAATGDAEVEDTGQHEPQDQAPAPAPAPAPAATPAPAAAPADAAQAQMGAEGAAALQGLKDAMEPVSAGSASEVAIETVATELGAPGLGTTWKARWEWLREAAGGDTNKAKAVLNSLDITYASMLENDQRWAKVLNHALERRDAASATTEQKAA
jgi:hypothetical protein